MKYKTVIKLDLPILDDDVIFKLFEMLLNEDSLIEIESTHSINNYVRRYNLPPVKVVLIRNLVFDILYHEKQRYDDGFSDIATVGKTIKKQGYTIVTLISYTHKDKIERW